MILINLFQIIVTYTFNANRITGRCNILKDSHLFQIIGFLYFFRENEFQLLILLLLYKILRFWSNISLNILSFWIRHFLGNFWKFICVLILIRSQCFMPQRLDVVPVFYYFFNCLFLNAAQLLLDHSLLRHHQIFFVH